MGFKAPKWYGDQNIPIVGKKNSSENEKLRVMLGNLCEFVMQNHPELTSEELKAIMKGEKADGVHREEHEIPPSL